MTDPNAPQVRLAEMEQKTRRVREALAKHAAAGVRFRGMDWFSWITAGGSSAVLQTVEEGVAEVLVTPQDVVVLTDEIEARRLQEEQLPEGVSLIAVPWADPGMRETLVQSRVQGGKVLSDRPRPGEEPLPESLVQQRFTLNPCEIERYRILGREASTALTEALLQAQPSWTEHHLAGQVGLTLQDRGCDVGLVQVAGEHRLHRYRHVPAQNVPIGQQVMVSVCARKWGLWVSLTRFLAFSSLPHHQMLRHEQVRQVEATLLQAAKVGTSLGSLYDTARQAYEAIGEGQAIREHHQGGTTGYGCRDRLLAPADACVLQANTALALNPSLTGAKLEDTLLLHEDGTLEVLTLDDRWPTVPVAGLPRPVLWVQQPLALSQP